MTCYDEVPETVTDRYCQDLADFVQTLRNEGRQVVICTAWKAFSPEQDWATQQRAAQLFLLIQPELSLKGLHDAFAKFNAAVRQVAATTDTPCLDLAKQIPADPDLFRDPTHLNAHGRALAAQLFADQLGPLIVAEGAD